jgi:hypothetical protein
LGDDRVVERPGDTSLASASSLAALSLALADRLLDVGGDGDFEPVLPPSTSS